MLMTDNSANAWKDSVQVASRYFKVSDIDIPKCKRMYDKERTWAVIVEPFVRTKKERTTVDMTKAGYCSLTSASFIGAFRSGAAKMNPCNK